MSKESEGTNERTSTNNNNNVEGSEKSNNIENSNVKNKNSTKDIDLDFDHLKLSQFDNEIENLRPNDVDSWEEGRIPSPNQSVDSFPSQDDRKMPRPFKRPKKPPKTPDSFGDVEKPDFPKKSPFIKQNSMNKSANKASNVSVSSVDAEAANQLSGWESSKRNQQKPATSPFQQSSASKMSKSSVGGKSAFITSRKNMFNSGPFMNVSSPYASPFAGASPYIQKAIKQKPQEKDNDSKPRSLSTSCVAASGAKKINQQQQQVLSPPQQQQLTDRPKNAAFANVADKKKLSKSVEKPKEKEEKTEKQKEKPIKTDTEESKEEKEPEKPKIVVKQEEKQPEPENKMKFVEDRLKQNEQELLKLQRILKKSSVENEKLGEEKKNNEKLLGDLKGLCKKISSKLEKAEIEKKIIETQNKELSQRLETFEVIRFSEKFTENNQRRQSPPKPRTPRSILRPESLKTTQNPQNQDEISILLAKLKSANEDLSIARKEVFYLNEKQSGLEVQLQVFENENESLKKNNGLFNFALDPEFANLNSSGSPLGNTGQSIIQKLQAEVSRLRIRSRELLQEKEKWENNSQQISKLQVHNQKLIEALSREKEETIKARAQIKKIETRIDEKVQIIKELDKEVESHKKAIFLQRQEIARAKNEIFDERSKSNKKEDSENDLKWKIKELTNELFEAKRVEIKKNRKIEEDESYSKSVLKQVSDLEKAKLEQEVVISGLKEQNKQANDVYNELRKDHAMLQQKIQVLESQNASRGGLEAKQHVLETENNMLRAKLEKSEAQHKVLSESNHALIQRIQKLESNLEKKGN